MEVKLGKVYLEANNGIYPSVCKPCIFYDGSDSSIPCKVIEKSEYTGCYNGRDEKLDKKYTVVYRNNILEVLEKL